MNLAKVCQFLPAFESNPHSPRHERTRIPSVKHSRIARRNLRFDRLLGHSGTDNSLSSGAPKWCTFPLFPEVGRFNFNPFSVGFAPIGRFFNVGLLGFRLWILSWNGRSLPPRLNLRRPLSSNGEYSEFSRFISQSKGQQSCSQKWKTAQFTQLPQFSSLPSHHEIGRDWYRDLNSGCWSFRVSALSLHKVHSCQIDLDDRCNIACSERWDLWCSTDLRIHWAECVFCCFGYLGSCDVHEQEVWEPELQGP